MEIFICQVYINDLLILTGNQPKIFKEMFLKKRYTSSYHKIICDEVWNS